MPPLVEAIAWVFVCAAVGFPALAATLGFIWLLGGALLGERQWRGAALGLLVLALLLWAIFLGATVAVCNHAPGRISIQSRYKMHRAGPTKGGMHPGF
jgi:hypothetical protein